MASKSISIKQYEDGDKVKWDQFVLKQSINGTILQSKAFLDYHPVDRFKDHSLMFYNGNNLIAVLPANVAEGERKHLISHQGSTFGGLILGKQSCKISLIEGILTELNQYLSQNGFEEITLKQASGIFQNGNAEMLDYFLFKDGYSNTQEIGFYVDYQNYADDVISNFTASRRRDYRYSLKNDLSFAELTTDEEIGAFYSVLCDNYTKFQKKPVHSLEELLDLKHNRLPEAISFYGVFLNNEMIAGGMIFRFDQNVFHTQYLAVKQEYNAIFANEYLYTSLITTAKEEGFQKLSFGTSTFEGGRVLNTTLALFKEGFGTQAYTNKTYHKILDSE